MGENELDLDELLAEARDLQAPTPAQRRACYRLGLARSVVKHLSRSTASRIIPLQVEVQRIVRSPKDFQKK